MKKKLPVLTYAVQAIAGVAIISPFFYRGYEFYAVSSLVFLVSQCCYLFLLALQQDDPWQRRKMVIACALCEVLLCASIAVVGLA
jgi:hypothetical protein